MSTLLWFLTYIHLLYNFHNCIICGFYLKFVVMILFQLRAYHLMSWINILILVTFKSNIKFWEDSIKILYTWIKHIWYIPHIPQITKKRKVFQNEDGPELNGEIHKTFKVKSMACFIPKNYFVDFYEEIKKSSAFIFI